MDTVVISIAILIVSLIILLLKKRNNRLVHMSANLPGPPTLPLFGNGLPIFKNPEGMLTYFCESQKKYGPVTKQWIGSVLYVFLSDPDDVEIILRDTQNIKKSATYTLLRSWLGEGLITATGKHWHTHRKIITPAFHFTILEKFVHVFNEKGRTLLKLLKEKSGNGAFNIFPFVNMYAFDAILETSMGTNCNFQEDRNSPYVQAIHRMTRIGHTRAFNVILRSPLIFPFTKLGNEQVKVLNTIHGYCNKVIKERKENLNDGDEKQETDDLGIKKRRAFLDLLLVGQKNGTGFTDQDILDEVNTFLFAGHDTISAAMGFTLYYLARHQDIQQKAYQEVSDLFGNETDNLTYQDLQNCQYVEMIVKEVLRIAPSVPVVSRTLEHDLKLKNYILPTGCNVSIFTYMIHRNADIYPEPDKFDPERFTIENSRKRHPYAFVPFSAGPRNCVGQRYAMLELKAFLVKMVSNFRILPGEEIENLQLFVVLKASNGINVKLERRI